jgi:multiple sugar transport system ATP-binding protein
MIAGTTREPGVVDAAGATFGIEARLSPRTGVTLGIRPEAFHLMEKPGANSLTGRIRLVEHLGSDLFVHLDLPGADEPLIARLSVEQRLSLMHGQTLSLTVNPENILLFDRDGERINCGNCREGKVTAFRNFA